MKNHSRGQITAVNLIELFITFLLYFIFVYPVLQPIINATVILVNATPNQFSPLLVVLMDAVPFFFLLALVMTAINYAIPHVENTRQY